MKSIADIENEINSITNELISLQLSESKTEGDLLRHKIELGKLEAKIEILNWVLETE